MPLIFLYPADKAKKLEGEQEGTVALTCCVYSLKVCDIQHIQTLKM